jgi:hypothetical protein
MTPNEPINSPRTDTNANLNSVRAASTIVLLAGIWFFVSPWVYNAYAHPNAWNACIVGALMFILGCIRIGRPAYLTGLSWCNTVLGIWAFFSPWIYGYSGHTGRLINSLCVGVVVFIFSIVSARMAVKADTIPAAHA